MKHCAIVSLAVRISSANLATLGSSSQSDRDALASASAMILSTSVGRSVFQADSRTAHHLNSGTGFHAEARCVLAHGGGDERWREVAIVLLYHPRVGVTEIAGDDH